MPWYAWMLLAFQITLFLVIFVIKPKKTEEVSPERHEDRIFKLYTQIEEMLDSFEEYVGETHTGLEEKRQELIELNRQAQVVYMQVLSAPKPAVVEAAAPPPAEELEPSVEPEKQAKPPAPPKKKAADTSRLTDKDKESLGRFATKPQKVRYLMSRGFSLDEVAKELDIGRGEVILIAELDK